MGVAPSRKILCSSGEFEQNEKRPNRKIFSISTNHRLVRNKLREKVQCIDNNIKEKTHNSVLVIQEPPESLQQKDV
jgi:hypothetical protein